MTEKPAIAPPGDLRARGQAFWRAVDAGWVLNLDERELLVEVCHTLDTVEALQLVLDRDGVLTTGSTGQTRVHPAVGELRASRVVLARLLGQVGLPDSTNTAMPSATTARARRAARARWGGRDASTA
jgi:hypothetical protein